MSYRHELLNPVEDCWFNDGGMIVFYVVLWYLPVIFDFLLGKKIFGVDFLQKGITFVFFVCEDTLDRGCRPGFLAAGCRYAFGGQHLRNRIR